MARERKSIKLTHTALKTKRDPGRYSIEGHRGLYLRVLVSGRRVWEFRTKTGGQRAYMALGPMVEKGTGEGWDHERATAEAARLRADADRRRASGVDQVNPVVAARIAARAKREAEARALLLAEARQREKEQAEALRPTLDKLAAQYLGVFVAEKRRRTGPKRWKDTEQRIYDREIAPRLGARKVGDIKAKDVAAMRNEIKADSTKRKAVAIVRALLSHAKSDGLIESNPAMGVKTQPSGQRDNVLTDDECKALWAADKLEGVRPSMLAAIKVQLATGQRAGEVLAMRWSDMREQDGIRWWVVPAEIAKNGREHPVPVAPQVWSLIDAQRPPPDLAPEKASPYVFPAWAAKTRAKPITASNYAHVIDATREALKLRHFTSHDLRRTCATKMAELKVLPHVIEAVLNHVSGAKAGVAGVYNRNPYFNEARAALGKWAKRLDDLAAGTSGAVSAKIVGIAAARAKA